MTKSIHHQTQKKANRLGFQLELRDEMILVRALEGTDHVLAMDEDANTAMQKAIDDPMLPPSDGSVVKMRYKKQYGKDASCQDAMAVAVNAFIRTSEGISIDKLYRLATDNGLDVGRWEHLNIGQQSMSIRNCLRGTLRRGERDVVVGNQVFYAQPEMKESA